MATALTPDSVYSAFLNPSTGKYDYEAIQKAVNEAASKIKVVGPPTLPTITKKPSWPEFAYVKSTPRGDVPGYYDYSKSEMAEGRLWRGVFTPYNLTGDPYATAEEKAAQLQIEGIRRDYETKRAALEQQAGRAATALQLTGAGTIAGLRGLESIGTRVKELMQTASGLWKAATSLAGENVKSAYERMDLTMAKLDQVNAVISKNRDFSKSHALQAAAQSAISSMKNEERTIVEQYGANSKEHAQFKATKQQSLAVAASNIHANYQQLAEDQGKTFLNATNEALYRSNMFINFAEQTRVETLRYAAQQDSAYQLQGAEVLLDVERIAMGGMENLGNWLTETPAFVVDLAPYLSAIAQHLPVAPHGWEIGEWTA